MRYFVAKNAKRGSNGAVGVGIMLSVRLSLYRRHLCCCPYVEVIVCDAYNTFLHFVVIEHTIHS